ncbi:hypothetical protein MXB_1861, partial [Myxobolus squamalis]
CFKWIIFRLDNIIENFSICSTLINESADSIDDELNIASIHSNLIDKNLNHHGLTVYQMIKHDLEKLRTIQTEKYLYFIKKIESSYCFILVFRSELKIDFKKLLFSIQPIARKF